MLPPSMDENLEAVNNFSQMRGAAGLKAPINCGRSRNACMLKGKMRSLSARPL